MRKIIITAIVSALISSMATMLFIGESEESESKNIPNTPVNGKPVGEIANQLLPGIDFASSLCRRHFIDYLTDESRDHVKVLILEVEGVPVSSERFYCLGIADVYKSNEASETPLREKKYFFKLNLANNDQFEMSMTDEDELKAAYKIYSERFQQR